MGKTKENASANRAANKMKEDKEFDDRYNQSLEEYEAYLKNQAKGAEARVTQMEAAAGRQVIGSDGKVYYTSKTSDGTARLFDSDTRMAAPESVQDDFRAPGGANRARQAMAEAEKGEENERVINGLGRSLTPDPFGFNKPAYVEEFTENRKREDAHEAYLKEGDPARTSGEAPQGAMSAEEYLADKERKKAADAGKAKAWWGKIGRGLLNGTESALTGGASLNQLVFDETHRAPNLSATLDKAKQYADEASQPPGDYNHLLNDNGQGPADGGKPHDGAAGAPPQAAGGKPAEDALRAAQAAGAQGQEPGAAAAAAAVPEQEGAAAAASPTAAAAGALEPGAAVRDIPGARNAQGVAQVVNPVAALTEEALAEIAANPGDPEILGRYLSTWQKTKEGNNFIQSAKEWSLSPEEKTGLLKAAAQGADAFNAEARRLNKKYRDEGKPFKKDIRDRTEEELPTPPPPPLPEPEPEPEPPPAPAAPPDTPLEYPVDERLKQARNIPVIKDLWGARALGKYGNTTNSQLEAMRQGIYTARENKAREQMAGALGQKMENMGFELRLQANQVAASFANASTQVQEAKMAKLFNDWTTNPAYSPKAPGISQEEREARYQVLNKTMQSLRAQVQQNAFKVQEGEAMVSLENNTNKIIDDVKNNRYPDTRNALADMKLQLNNARQFLSPQQYNKAFISGISAVGEARIEADIQERIKQSGGNPITDVAGISAGYANTLTSLYGYVAGELGEGDADIFRIAAVGQAEKAQKALHEHNFNYLQGKQDEYEWNMTQGNYGKAQEIAASYNPVYKRMAESGDISAEGRHKGRDWFKPVQGKGSGSERHVAMGGLMDKYIPQIRAWMENAGGMEPEQAVLAIHNELQKQNGKEGQFDELLYNQVRANMASKFLSEKGINAPSDAMFAYFNTTRSNWEGRAKETLEKAGTKEPDDLQVGLKAEELRMGFNDGMWRLIYNTPEGTRDIGKYIRANANELVSNYTAQNLALFEAAGGDKDYLTEKELSGWMGQVRTFGNIDGINAGDFMKNRNEFKPLTHKAIGTILEQYQSHNPAATKENTTINTSNGRIIIADYSGGDDAPQYVEVEERGGKLYLNDVSKALTQNADGEWVPAPAQNDRETDFGQGVPRMYYTPRQMITPTRGSGNEGQIIYSQKQKEARLFNNG